MPYYITVKKASDTGKPELRIVEVGKYNREDHGAIYAAAEDIGPQLHGKDEKASVRLMRDGQLRLCPVRKIQVSVTAQIILHGTDRHQLISERKDFLDVLEIIR